MSVAEARSWGRTIGTVMKRGRARTILNEAREAVARWPEFAALADPAGQWRDRIQSAHRMSFPER